MKRAEIEAERQAAYRAEQKALEEARVAKLAEKRKREEDAAAEDAAREEKRRKLADESRRRREEKEWEDEQARRRRLGLPESQKKDKDAVDEENELGAGEEDIPEEELLAKLRNLGEPVVLFGESHRGRVRRYKRLTTVVTKGPIPTTLQPVDEKDMKVDGKVPKDVEGRRWLFRQLASYFIMVMTAYEQAMEAESRDTTASRNAYNAMVQTRENIKPVRSKYPTVYMRRGD